MYLEDVIDILTENMNTKDKENLTNMQKYLRSSD